MNETENLKQKARDVRMRTLVLSLVIPSSTLIFPFFVSKDLHKHDSPWELWRKWFYLRTLAMPGGASGKEPACQYRSHKRRGFDPWVGKIPWRRTRQPTPVFLPGESSWTAEPDGLRSVGSQRVGHNWAAKHKHACFQSRACPRVRSQSKNTVDVILYSQSGWLFRLKLQNNKK